MKKVARLIGPLFILSSCSGLSFKKLGADNVPEIKKEITHTYEFPELKEKKEALSISIAKSKLLSTSYVTNDCPEQIVQPAPDKMSLPLAQAPSVIIPQSFKLVEKKLIPDNFIVFDVDISNETNHVIKFSQSYFILRDPVGKIHKAKNVESKDWWDIEKNWCSTKEQQNNYLTKITSVSPLTENVVMFPDEKSNYQLIFSPDNLNLPGEWKVELYEIPVATSSAGVPTITDHFILKGYVKKWETMFKKSKPDGTFEKVESKQLY